jgi:quercetin 2,3-dioxygenase
MTGSGARPKTRDPIAHHGPFVMNTQEEIAQAIRDYRLGRMGHLA